MTAWVRWLPLDPVPTLLAADDEALSFFVRRDLLGEGTRTVATLWRTPESERLVGKQQEDGSWRYPGKNRNLYPDTNYDLLETFKSLGQLVDKYGFDRRHPAIEKAASFVFSCQTDEGDVRGILGTQYMPYYHAAIWELLIKAGYGDDPRIERGLDWLVSMRQDDGGWIVPAQAIPAKGKTRDLWRASPVSPDRSRPFSHLATGMVLRAFAVHPPYRHLDQVLLAGNLLKSRFFQSDKYNDRKAPLYWTKFQYPFWWTNILTALDSLSLLEFTADDGDVQKALDWFKTHQERDGLWRTSYEQATAGEPRPREAEAMRWVGLAVCRVFRRFHA
jgi:hypothetical protein